MNKRMVLGLMAMLLCVEAYPQFTDTLYISPYAAGSKTGQDWINALDTIPEKYGLQRGRLYYVADGVNRKASETIVLHPLVSGTDSVVIRKATVAAHGTGVGWHDSLGDGYAQIPLLSVCAPYIIVDGVIGGGPGSWKSGHGFRMSSTVEGRAVYVHLYRRTGNPTAADTSYGNNCRFEHIEIGPADHQYHGCDNEAHTSFYFNQPHTDNVTIRHCYVHQMSNVGATFGNDPNNLLIEYCCFDSIGNNCGVNHGAGLEFYASTNVTIRYNRISNPKQTGGIGAYSTTGVADSFFIYGNILYIDEGWSGYGNGMIYNTSGSLGWRNLKVYNNTFYGLSRATINAFVFGISHDNGGIEFKNNLMYDCMGGYNSANADFDYNAADNADPVPGDAHLQRLTASPFADQDNYDFSLAAATQPGVTLPAPFDADMYGNVRGSDGGWDRGALEYATNQVRMTNDECRVKELKNILVFTNPCNFNQLCSFIRNSTLDIRNYSVPDLYDLNGHPIDITRVVKSGVYLIRIQGNESLHKITLLK